MNRFISSSWEVVKTIVIAGAVVFLVRSFLFQPFLVSGASMEPNIQESNYLIIDELTYHFREPKRGEVVVFRYPNDPSVFYIKRILGLPGEEVDVAGGVVAIDGDTVDERAYLKGAKTFNDVHIKLEPNAYFVMGDNRPNSFDSRSWGPVDRSLIVGRALVRLYPVTKIGIFPEEEYAL